MFRTPLVVKMYCLFRNIRCLHEEEESSTWFRILLYSVCRRQDEVNKRTKNYIYRPREMKLLVFTQTDDSVPVIHSSSFLLFVTALCCSCGLREWRSTTTLGCVMDINELRTDEVTHVNKGERGGKSPQMFHQKHLSILSWKRRFLYLEHIENNSRVNFRNQLFVIHVSVSAPEAKNIETLSCIMLNVPADRDIKYIWSYVCGSWV